MTIDGRNRVGTIRLSTFFQTMFRVRGNPVLKSLDRLAGIPAVALLGLLPKRRRPRELNRLGILRTAAIGDTLLLRGIIEDLRQQLAQTRIYLITGHNNAEAGALVADGCCEHVVIAEHNPAAAIARLRSLALDVVVDSGAWPRLDAVLSALSGAGYRVGFNTPGQSRHFAYDLAVPHSDRVHEVENFRSLFRALGLESRRDPSLSQMQFNPSDHAAPYVVFHPWSGGYRGALKEWSQGNWVRLGTLLRDLGRVVVTGTAGDVDRNAAFVRMLEAAEIDATSRAGEMNLRELACFLKGAAAVVSVNTGVMHLAAMVGAPTVALDGPTPSRRWGPIGPRARSVSSTLPGCGFINLGFEYDGQRTDCMASISAESVAAAVRAQVRVS